MKKYNDLEELKEEEFDILLEDFKIDKFEKIDDKEMNKKGYQSFFAIALNFTYIILSPIILLVSIYYVIIKKYNLKFNSKIFIILIFLGLVSGYWNLYKELKKIK